MFDKFFIIVTFVNNKVATDELSSKTSSAMLDSQCSFQEKGLYKYDTGSQTMMNRNRQLSHWVSESIRT